MRLQWGPTQIYRKVPAERYKFVEKGPVKRYNFFGERGPSKRYSKGPVKRYNFFQETGTSNRYTLGPVKRYNFFSNSLPHLFVITVSYIQFIPYTVYKVVPRKDTSFFH